MEQDILRPCPPEPDQPHGHHGRPDRPEPPPRCGAGRVIAYFLVLIVVNVMLAVFALYMFGNALAFDWSALKEGSLQVILESALQLLLIFSPVILTIVINRLLYRAFRGWRRFPHGIWFFALLVILLVQTFTVLAIVGYGFVDGTNGLNIESIGSVPAD